MLNSAHYFEALFANAKENAFIIMSKDGVIQQVNDAFTKAYGYTTEDLKSKTHGVLFIEKDRKLLRPEIELNKTLREGSSSDENYLVHKDGTRVWVTGESVLVKQENDTGIVKIIHNIHAQKQLERYILAADELLEDVFNSVKSGLLLLDSGLRTIKANTAFCRIFSCNETIQDGGKIQEIPHQFWSEEEVKNDLRNVITRGERLKKEYILDSEAGAFQKIHITSKLLSGEDSQEKRLLLVIRDI